MNILGLSGGLDSTYSAYLAFHRHMDITLIIVDDVGWSTPQADNNIQAIIDYTDFPVYRVALPDSLNDLRRAFLRANVLHVETPNDVAIQSILYNKAKQLKADQIISGGNKLEGQMPYDFSVVDSRYIRSVWKRYGEGAFPDDFPMLSMWEKYQYKKMLFNILETIDYRPIEALKELQKIGVEYYGVKHYEDIFTKFNQGLRFFKFNVDVRGVNFKAMVRAGQMTLHEMYDALSFAPYSYDQFLGLCTQVEDKIGIKIDEDFLTQGMNSWSDFKTNKSWIKMIKSVWKYKLTNN